jgi:hypothetical protein
MFKSYLTYTFALFFLPMVAAAQSAENSLSIYGAGYQDTNLSIRGFSMGDAGSAAPTAINANFYNPAMLTFAPYTQLEVGYYIDRRDQTLNDVQQLSFGGNLGYFSLAFPVTRNYRMGLSLRPLGTSDFEFENTFRIEGDGQGTFTERRTQTGSISKFDLKQAYFLGKGLSVGLETAFLFGNKIIDSFIFYDGVISNFNNAIKRQTNYKGLSIKPGIHYQYQTEKHAISAGLAYTFNYGLNAEEFTTTGFSIGAQRPNRIDTLSEQTVEYRLKRPGSILAGFAFNKPNVYSLALDYYVRDWSSIVNESEELRLGNNWYVGSGVEWVPNYNSLNSYLARITYRAGVKLEDRNFIGTDDLQKQVSMISYRAGLGLPFRRGLTYINLGGEYSQSLSGSFIQENYLRFFLSLSFNDQWFIQRKFD